MDLKNQSYAILLLTTCFQTNILQKDNHCESAAATNTKQRLLVPLKMLFSSLCKIHISGFLNRMNVYNLDIWCFHLDLPATFSSTRPIIMQMKSIQVIKYEQVFFFSSLHNKI